MARKLVVEIVGDTSKLESAFKRGSRHADQFGQSVGKLRVGLGTLAKSTVVVAGVSKAIDTMTGAISGSIDEWKDQQQVAAQTNAVLKSTQGVANVSAKHVDELAASLSNLSGTDDEAIQSGENLLLTFTNVRNFAGKGNKIFDRTAKIMTDVSVAMGIEPRKAALQLGKALQDPVRGVGQLRKVGVNFSQSQRDMVKRLVESGRTLDAQKMILRELQTEFGGSAKAAGKTLPGQLNRLRETLRNVGGDIVGSIVPAFTSAIDGINKFAHRLQAARGLRAKFDVVVEGVEDLGRKIYDAVRGAVEWAANKLRSVDWRSIANSIRDRLASIDWPGVLRSAAQGLSRALVTVLNSITDLRERIDWQRVGKYIVDGLGAAVAAAIVFLRNVDWVGLVKAIVRFYLSALKAQANLVLGIGKELARLLWEGIKAGLNWLGQKVFELSARVVLKLLEPFSHIPWKGGQWARDLKAKLQSALANAAQYGRARAQQAGRSVGQAFGRGVRIGLTVAEIQSEKDLEAARRRAFAQAQSLRQRGKLRALRGAGAEAYLPPPPKPKPIAGTGELPDAVQTMIDRLQFNVDKAGLTKTMKDDLAALRILESYLQKQLAKHKHNLELERALLGVQQQINGILGDQAQAATEAAQKRREAAKQRREAAIARAQRSQFAALGLGPGGEERVPGVAALRKRAVSIQKALSGAGLLTPSILRMIEQIGKVLAGKWGKAGKDVRAKIAEIFDGWRDEIKGQQDQTTRRTTEQFASVSTDRLLAGLGLDPKTAERVRVRIAALGAGMTHPVGRSRQFVGAGAGGVNISGDVNVYNAQNIGQLENQLTKRQASRAHTRRGAR